MTPDERRARTAQFRAALEDGILRECLDDVERRFMDEWKTATTLDERENLHRAVRILGLLRSHMAYIEAGEQSGGVSAIRRTK